MGTGKIRKFATRTVHDVPLTFEDGNGARVEEKFTVVYRSYSNKTLQEQKAVLDEKGNAPLSALLGLMVSSITDSDGEHLTNDQGERAELNADVFAEMAIENAEAIYSAIQADVNPPKASAEPGPSGSSPEASAE
jgi:hypothetical protein